MEKKIQKKQREINEAQEERARKKVLYDSQIVIVEGHRNTVRELEKRAEGMLRDYVDADNRVKDLLTELNLMSNELEGNNVEN